MKKTINRSVTLAFIILFVHMTTVKTDETLKHKNNNIRGKRSKDTSFNNLRQTNEAKISLELKRRQQTSLANIVTDVVSDVTNIIRDRPEIAATFVRLSFHDCIGGCDGCVDMNNSDNFGLGVAINSLTGIVENPLYTSFGLTRADIWALAGITGLNHAKPDTSFFFSMNHYGRINCEDVGTPCLDVNGNDVGCTATTGPHRDLPLSDLDTEDVLDFFNDEFGFNDDETVALMGVHTIGVAKQENSGFNGPQGWVRREDRLDNQYYAGIVGGGNDLFDGPNWSQEIVDNRNGIPDRFQWVRGNGEIMLNSDIALVRTFGNSLNKATGEVSCNFKNRDACDAAKTLPQMGVYRENNDVWLNDFKLVFEKMIINGYRVGCDGSQCLKDLIGYNPIEPDTGGGGGGGQGGQGGQGDGRGGGRGGGDGGGGGRGDGRGD